ncbi:unnamed protein product [Rhizophagus irregularis]|nr:unnamed protein product [Rhizophagus irregularis]
MFPDKFLCGTQFDSKKLNDDEIIQFNKQIAAESEWFIDRLGMCARSVNCERRSYRQTCSPCSLIQQNPYFWSRVRIAISDPKNIKHTPKFYYSNNPLLTYLKNNQIKQLNKLLGTENSSSSEFWLELASKAADGAFDRKPVFKGLCYIMLQAAEREEDNKGIQNLKYSNEFLDFLVILESISLKALDLFRQNLAGMTIRRTIRRHRSTSENAINNPDLCYENVARFKRLLDVLNYKGPVAAMTDCTKLKTGLQYSSKLGCIVRSTLDHSDCKIEIYDDIYDTVSNIKNKNAIVKDVRIYVLQVPLLKFPPIVVALIPTGNDNAEKVFALHQKLIDIATRLDIHIISIGSDGAATEFQAQNLLQATKTNMRVQHRNIQFGINFNCPVFPKIGPVIRIQDPKYGKKTARNAAMSGARLLTFGNSTVRFNQLLKLSLKEDSVMYKRNIIRLD